VNLRGEVVGVNTAVNRAGQSIGFAIPISAARVVIESVREHGRIVRPWLGVRYVLLTRESAKENKLQLSSGALIAKASGSSDPGVVKGSPAEKAGLKEDDVLLEIDGQPVTLDRPLSSLIARKKPGEAVKVLYWRDGAEKTVEIVLGELPESL
jgi:serine protease Do